jgi:hypothetical protein
MPQAQLEIYLEVEEATILQKEVSRKKSNGEFPTPCYYLKKKLYFNRMKFGLRKPSLSKMLAARTSPKRIIKNALGLRAPRGWGWLTNPKKAAYNKVYNRTSFSLIGLMRKLFK